MKRSDSGKKFGEISGYQPAGQFQKSLDALLKKAGK